MRCAVAKFKRVEQLNTKVSNYNSCMAASYIKLSFLLGQRDITTADDDNWKSFWEENRSNCPQLLQSLNHGCILPVLAFFIDAQSG
jgi:hypothetical protein